MNNTTWNRLAIAIAATVAPLGQAALAQQTMETITITGARVEETIPLDLSRYGNRVEVITGEEIAQHGFVDVTQALQMLVPGLHVRPKNGQFDYFDASLQGSRNAEILWLIDVMELGSGHEYWMRY